MHRWLRLRNSSDFERLRGEGRAQHHAMLLLSYAPNNLLHNRYGFITPKRLGKAIKRNRIRRQLREAVRLQHPHLQQGYDIVIIARMPLMGQRFDTIQRIVYDLCAKA
ncbi:MAG: ribonuclease P protein component, partial [Chloroflexi bacterium]|nr:ribonuclease P protein component [Chloroflexota bacterium]